MYVFVAFSRAEKLQMLNLRPTSQVELQLVSQPSNTAVISFCSMYIHMWRRGECYIKVHVL